MLRLLIFTTLFSFSFLSCRFSDTAFSEKETIPKAAYETWEYIKKNNKAPKGYVGGRRFGNYEKLLPKKTADNKTLSYREWDIYPKKKGQNRGAERLVTSSEGNAYYTADHYLSFTKLEP